MGAIIETGTSFPGNTGQIPSEVAPVAEMLRLNGYATAAFGKWHETAAWEASIAGPFDRWPTRQSADATAAPSRHRELRSVCRTGAPGAFMSGGNTLHDTSAVLNS